MEDQTSPKSIRPFYIFPSSPRIKSKISTNIKTLIHPLDVIPTVTELALALLPKAKASLLRISKEANARLRLPPSTTRVLLSFLESIDIKAFIDGFVVPCLKELMKIVRGRSGPRRRRYPVARRLRLSLLRKFRYRVRKSASSSYFRFHYNWSSRSYTWPVPANVLPGHQSGSYRVLSTERLGNSGSSGSTDPSEVSSGGGDSHCRYSQLNFYLEWLEQRESGRDHTSGESSSRTTASDIDTMAGKFIEEKYETFVLEKQESERRFREMMVRSL